MSEERAMSKIATNKPILLARPGLIAAYLTMDELLADLIYAHLVENNGSMAFINDAHQLYLDDYYPESDKETP